jgi:hypothetical protein
MEKLIIDQEQYEGFIKLLNSKDKENWTVALTAVENCDHDECLGILISLFKLGLAETENWKKEAPSAFKKISKYVSSLNYTNILDELVDNSVDIKHIQFIFNRYGEFLHNVLVKKGYSVEDININIKTTENESVNATSGQPG